MGLFLDAEREKLLEEPYNSLKKSLDELFDAKATNSSNAPALLSNMVSKKSDETYGVNSKSSIDSKISVYSKNLNSQDSKASTGKKMKKPEIKPKRSSLKAKGKKVVCQAETSHPVKKTTNKSKSQDNICRKNSSGAKEANNKIVVGGKTENFKLPSMTQPKVEKAASSGDSTEKNQNEKARMFNFKCQRKIPVTNTIPSMDQKVSFV